MIEMGEVSEIISVGRKRGGAMRSGEGRGREEGRREEERAKSKEERGKRTYCLTRLSLRVRGPEREMHSLLVSWHLSHIQSKLGAPTKSGRGQHTCGRRRVSRWAGSGSWWSGRPRRRSDSAASTTVQSDQLDQYRDRLAYAHRHPCCILMAGHGINSALWKGNA